MTDDNHTILADLREFLLSIPNVAALVDERIRPNRAAQGDKQAGPFVILELADGTDFHTIDDCPANTLAAVTISCRAELQTTADEVAEAIRTNFTSPASGLDGYAGPIGTDGATVLKANRTDFDSGAIDDDDHDDDGLMEHQASYAIWYQPTN